MGGGRTNGVRLPGSRAARAWMAWCDPWKREGRLPPIAELVLAERFVRETQPVRDVALSYVAALLALDVRRGSGEPWDAFDARRFTLHRTLCFDGDLEQANRLIDAAVVFLGWLHARGELGAGALARLRRELAAEKLGQCSSSRAPCGSRRGSPRGCG